MNAEANALLRPRVRWMDNLRTITILFVVLYHIGGVYESAGLWGSFWIVDDPTTMIWVSIMGIAFDVFVMPTLFFVSGYLTPASLANRPAGKFAIGKFRRYFDKPGKIWSKLNRNSYGVYIIHVIMIGIFGTFLMKLGLPVYVKYPLLIILTYLGSNLLVSTYKNMVAKA